MIATPSCAPDTVTPVPATRRVVDAPTRMFHWLFALCFVGAYITADGERWRLLHVTLGYTFAGLLVFRLIYGLVGPRQARLSLMWRKLATLPAWLSAFKPWQPSTWAQTNWRQGQNLLMALTVVSLLALVVPLTLTGYLNYNDLGGELMKDVHETTGEFYLWTVLGHLGLIALLSVLRRKNQALPMLTGRCEGSGPDLVKHNARWLAALMLVGVLAYWTWEWQQSPAGLLAQPSAIDSGRGGRNHDDD